MKLSKVKIPVAVLALALSATSFVALADTPSSKGSSEQSKQQSDKGPEVRLGKPAFTINSDADQNNYDNQDGGISGVTVAGSRVFEARVANNGATRTTSSSQNLIKHTGSPMATTNIYPIFWGTSFGTNYKATVVAYLSTLASSTNNLNKVTTQYMVGGTVPNVAVVSSTTFTDISAAPTSAPTTASILAEAYKVVKAANSNATMDPNGLYMVFTNNFPSSANYCAWHGAGSVSGSKIFQVAYQPFLATFKGCPALTSTGGYAYTTDGVAAVANVASHEYYEAITDPLLNAWYDSTGAEIGDKCAWTHGVALIGTYYVQTEWSNKVTGCAVS